MSSSVGDQIYSGTASFGRIWAVISAVMFTLIGIVAVIGGIYLINYDNHLKSAKGVVKDDSSCTTSTDSDGNTFTSCTTSVEYSSADGVKYNPTLSSSVSYKAGQTVTVWYDPNSPDKGTLSMIPKSVGWVAIGFGIVIPIFTWIWVYVTRHSKFAASVTGLGGIAKLI